MRIGVGDQFCHLAGQLVLRQLRGGRWAELQLGIRLRRDDPQRAGLAVEHPVEFGDDRSRRLVATGEMGVDDPCGQVPEPKNPGEILLGGLGVVEPGLVQPVA